jgi:hypothetical protein
MDIDDMDNVVGGGDIDDMDQQEEAVDIDDIGNNKGATSGSDNIFATGKYVVMD